MHTSGRGDGFSEETFVSLLEQTVPIRHVRSSKEVFC